MPTVMRFVQAQFLPILKWQALAFMRVEPPFVFQGEDKFAADTYPAAADPIHFAACEGDSLTSCAATIRLALEHAYTTKQRGSATCSPSRPTAARVTGAKCSTWPLRTCWSTAAPMWRSCSATPPGALLWRWRLGNDRGDDRQRLAASTLVLFISDRGRQGKQAFATAPLALESVW
jgi:hypothetical protein